MGKLHHFNRGRTAFQGMSGAEYLVYRILVCPVILKNQYVLLQGVNLHLSINKKIF
jgi:hypothetical protein